MHVSFSHLLQHTGGELCTAGSHRISHDHERSGHGGEEVGSRCGNSVCACVCALTLEFLTRLVFSQVTT